MIYLPFLTMYQYLMLEINPVYVGNKSGNVFIYMTYLAMLLNANAYHEYIAPTFVTFKQNSLKCLAKSLILSQLLLTLVNSTIGIFGYMTFGNKIEQNILQMYNLGDPVVAIGLFGYGVLSIAYCPTILLCCRNTIQVWILHREGNFNSYLI